MNLLTENEIRFYTSFGFDKENLNQYEMYPEIKEWAKRTIMETTGIEGFFEEKENYGVE